MFLTSFLSLILAFSGMAQAATNSQKIWKQYFPKANCFFQECAKKVPSEALSEALEKANYFYQKKLTQTTWMVIIDFDQHSSKKRGYLINLKTGATEAFLVAHGIGSDDGDGQAIDFSNHSGSHKSSLGLYLTAETYSGDHGYSLKLDGKESTNSAARSRAIVVHPADYVSDAFVKTNARTGRSHGCPAIDPKISKRVIDLIKGGSLFYIYSSIGQ
jgi:hypothetical protein